MTSTGSTRSARLESAQRLPLERLIAARSRSIDASGIRRVFDLAARLQDPINLSIGQPDFAVPEVMREAAAHAVRENRNGYSVTQGIPELHHALWNYLRSEVGWNGPSEELGCIVTSGTSGGLMLGLMAVLDPGDEYIVADPYFVMYPQIAKMIGATCVTCDTYPDFQLTAERVQPLITPRTKAVVLNSPSNPCGSVMPSAQVRELVQLCNRRGVLLISDEIYDEFCFPDACEQGQCPSAARFTDECLLVRGFGKTYGCTGWRMGYAAGPMPLIQEMAKLQQYTFVCAPTPLQWGVIPSFGFDLAPIIAEYARRRDSVMAAFDGITEVTRPGGAFYAFVKVPERLGLNASEFVEQAIAHRVLIIPGNVFSHRNTHFRLSFAAPPAKLAEGLAILRGMMTA